ncbi:hypothetical protein HDV01_006780 [Terramyces sp. JEL0728]|nr:hypothetical protein HDV01_006780 [Terramyces sp. JEL0728]
METLNGEIPRSEVSGPVSIARSITPLPEPNAILTSFTFKEDRNHKDLHIPLKGGVKRETRVPVLKRDEDFKPPRIAKPCSQISLKVKPKQKIKHPDYANIASTSFMEITRLISVNDEQKLQIHRLQQELKTLKIVNARQEKGLQALNKEQGDFPKVFKAMNEELRVTRIDRQRSLEKQMLLEKNSISQAEEYHRLQVRAQHLKARLKQYESPDAVIQNEKTLQHEAGLKQCYAKIESLQTLLEKGEEMKLREVIALKTKISKLIKELDVSKAEVIRLTNCLHERERNVNPLLVAHLGNDDDSVSVTSKISLKSTSKFHPTKSKYKPGHVPLSKIVDIDELQIEKTRTPVVTISLAKPEVINESKDTPTLEEKKTNIFKPSMAVSAKSVSPNMIDVPIEKLELYATRSEILDRKTPDGLQVSKAESIANDNRSSYSDDFEN